MLLSGQSPDGRLVEIVELRTTRGSWPASSTPSSRAGPSGRIRCSTASSPPPSPSPTVASPSSGRADRQPDPDAPSRRPCRSAPTDGVRRRSPSRCHRDRLRHLTSRSARPLVDPGGRRLRSVDRRRRRARRGRLAVGPAGRGRISLLVPANAIGVWLAVAFAPRRVRADDPDRRAARADRPAQRRRCVLPAVRRSLGSGFRVDRGIPRGDGVGSRRARRRPGDRRRRRRLAARDGLAASHRGRAADRGAGRRGPRASAARASSISTSSQQTPAILLFLAEIVIGLALPFLLLRRGERLRGYVATIVLAVVAGLAIGPVTTLIRGIADRF